MINGEKERLFRPFLTAAISRCPAPLRALDTTRRVHIVGGVNRVTVSDIATEAATDIPCILESFITLSQARSVHELPHHTNQLRCLQGIRMDIKGFLCFSFRLGKNTLPIKTVLIPTQNQIDYCWTTRSSVRFEWCSIGKGIDLL